MALVFKALTDVIILDDFKTCFGKLRSKLVDSQPATMTKPPPVPPKDFQIKGKTSTFTCTTAKSSPTLVCDQSPKVSPRSAKTQDGPGVRVQKSRSVREVLGRVGTRLSPLPSAEQMRDDIIPSERSPGLGGSHMIHVRMDLGLNRFVSRVVARRPLSNQLESPLDPTWPRSGGLRRELSILSNSALSSNERSSSSSVPTVPDRTPTWSENPTPRAT